MNEIYMIELSIEILRFLRKLLELAGSFKSKKNK